MANLDIYLYRMTHMVNIPHILKYGITHSRSSECNANYVAIGDKSLISSRNEYLLSNGKEIGSYIPFYFFYRMPMLYVIQKGYNGVDRVEPQEIVYCLLKIKDVVERDLEFVFTDGHAKNKLSRVYLKTDVDCIDKILDWTAIRSVSWKSETDIDLKRRKEAEFLIEEDVPAEIICGFVVYNDEARRKLTEYGISDNKIAIRPEFYF
jgi:hypothetical protein